MTDELISYEWTEKDKRLYLKAKQDLKDGKAKLKEIK